jgi:hypothetical protein
MFRALRQFAIIIIFLLLSVFAALYFQEDRGYQSMQAENESAAWLVKVVKKGGSFLSAIASLSLASRPKQDIAENEQFANWQEVEIYDFNNSEALTEGKILMEGFSQKAEQSEFRQFFDDFLKNAPSLYLNTKVYSNAWRNIRSLEWLRLEQ